MKEVHVAVGVVRQGDRILIARRPDDAHQGGLLEFPGGKVEPEERVQQALVRELDEEVGLRIDPRNLRPVIGIRHDYGDKRVFLDVWETDRFEGEPHGREGQPVQWLAVDALHDDDFPAANRPIIRALRLPHQYPITGDAGMDGAALVDHTCRRLAALRPSICLFRAPWLSRDAYLDAAGQLLDWCSARSIRLMLHGDPALLASIPAAGIHLPWHVARRLDTRPLASSGVLGVSCHQEDELAHAAHLGADFVTLGPVAETASHPDAVPMGWPRFTELAARATVPVYALGGLSLEDVERAREAGAQGVAGIGTWWSNC
ncbi:Nudix family hydrolase [Marinobacter halodurans]|uniref:8-oxo-dGTP diphosphatase n=1 Tax=Marinobacter halodurans TaxID=2528979 RepID=A0ABY1ZL66_9GAMM|nr:Nudix family hydrolase [Marinobacter halodurans]TBW56243.1 Nudix family hydrolase [Marinobacter halodurans]